MTSLEFGMKNLELRMMNDEFGIFCFLFVIGITN